MTSSFRDVVCLAVMPILTERVSESSRRIRILVVDDMPDILEMLALYLSNAGYGVTACSSAKEAIRLAHEEAFDLVVSDIGMPEMDGYKLAQRLRCLKRYQDMPMFAVSGFSDYVDRERSFKCGYTGHLAKPIDPFHLIDLIKQSLRHS